MQTTTLLVDTNSSGVAQSDMTPWMLTLSFVPIGLKPDNFPYILNE
jgi:hypothetical protein